METRGTRVEQKAHGKDIVRFTAPSGIGRFVLSGGYENIRCGDRKFGWQYPAGVNFPQRPESKMQLAPTRWETVGDIRLDDPKLVWYSFDPKRPETRIPLRAL